MAFKISGTTAVPVTLYTLTFNYLPLEQIQLGRALDWDNLGWPYDKKLQQLTIEYDTQNEPVTLNLDMSAGISPALETQTFQTVTLQSPASSVESTRKNATTSIVAWPRRLFFIVSSSAAH